MASNDAPMADSPSVTSDSSSSTTATDPGSKKPRTVTADEYFAREQQEIRRQAAERRANRSVFARDLIDRLVRGQVAYAKRPLEEQSVEAVAEAVEMMSVASAPTKLHSMEKRDLEEAKKELRRAAEKHTREAVHRAGRSIDEYNRKTLPVFCRFEPKPEPVLRVFGKLISEPGLVRATTALHGLKERLRSYVEGLEEEMNARVARGVIFPMVVDTPALYALLVRPEDAQSDEWTVPPVIGSVHLYRFYNAVKAILSEGISMAAHGRGGMEASAAAKNHELIIRVQSEELNVVRATLLEQLDEQLLKWAEKEPKACGSLDEIEKEIKKKSSHLERLEIKAREATIQNINAVEALLLLILGHECLAPEFAKLSTPYDVPELDLCNADLIRSTLHSAAIIPVLSSSLLRYAHVDANKSGRREKEAELQRLRDWGATFLLQAAKTCEAHFMDNKKQRSFDELTPRCVYWMWARSRAPFAEWHRRIPAKS